MNDGTGLAEALLGLSGFRVLAVSETPDELVVEIETTAEELGVCWWTVMGAVIEHGTP